ncbi:cdc17 [Candida margitis]|uniref:cdc17 n=1 Tax=Candida margitis TaxID=1775924 RepID=UPI0022263B26|nr:cdc17 [Candida margitis]KAI5966049.1 cdc17 [Candida margitis]
MNYLRATRINLVSGLLIRKGNYHNRVMAQQQSIARFFGGTASLDAARKKKTKTPPSPQKEVAASPKNSKRPDLITPPDLSPQLKKPKLNAKEEEKEKDEQEDVHDDETAPEESKSGSTSDSESYSKHASESEAQKLIELSESQQKQTKKEGSSLLSASKIPYSSLTDIMEKIEAESSRLKITAIISQYFLDILQQQNDVSKLVKIVYLFINRLGPDYEPDLELGLGETLLVKAISEGYGRTPAKIKQDLKEYGDLGIVAQKSRSGQRTMFKPTSLDVDTVFDNLTKIAKSTGKDSQSKKIGIINKMLTACDVKHNEAKFLIRSLENKLRIGLAGPTILVGLAQAFVNYENLKLDKPKKVSPEKLAEAEDIVREAYTRIPNYQILIENAFKYGVFNLLDHCKLTPGIPLKPMLAKPTKSMSEVLDRFQDEKFTCEYKYDGERAQIHLLPNGDVRIYSRNSEDMSQRYPDLISIIKEFSKTQEHTSMILDCEAVAWDRVQKKILPFQVLSTRKRKDVNESDITVHICLFAFDLLYYNNESLLTCSLSERRSIMFSHLQPLEGKFQFATSKDSTSLEILQQFLDQSVHDSCEGLMVKMLEGSESYYEPSKRSRNWLKLKKDYLAGVGDSLDLVVVGAYNGKGKRTGTYGGFLLASYNQDTGDLETTCKIGTGFNDEMLTQLYEKLHPSEITKPKEYYVYDKTNSNAAPDVWFEPTMLFEVLTADLSLSPIYKAAHSEYGKGISLRFPRFLRIRDDKGIEDATSSTEVAEFYERQAHIQNS